MIFQQQKFMQQIFLISFLTRRMFWTNTSKFLLHKPEITEFEYFSDAYSEPRQASEKKALCENS